MTVQKNCILIFSIASSFLLSQEKVKSIDSVKIKKLSDKDLVQKSAFTVTSIDTKSLKNSNADAKDVLGRVAGVRILEDGGLGSDINLTLNGFTGQQVKVFMDGMPIDRFSSSFRLSNIPVNTIERIDVYKGVVPAELGTDALGGVINIITNKKKNYTDISYGYGSFNTHRASLNASHTDAKTGWMVRGSANLNYSDNDYKVYVPIVRNYMQDYYADVRRFHDRYRSGNASIETGITNKSFADNLLFGITASADDKQVQNGNTMNKVYGGITTESHTVVPTLKYSKKNIFLPGLDANFFAAYNMSQSKIHDTLEGVTFNWLGEQTVTPGSNAGELSRTDSKIDDKEFSSGLNLGYKITEGHAVVMNYLYSNFHRNISDRLNPDRVENQFPKTLSKGVYSLAYQMDALPKMHVTAFSKFYASDAKGSKVYDAGLPTTHTDVFKKSQADIGYGLAANYSPFKSFLVKLSYEKAFRMPAADEIFGDGLFTLSNINIRPEKSNNINAGISYDYIKDDHSAYISGSFLYRNAYDLIYRVPTSGSPVSGFGNIAKARTYGVEGSVGYRFKNNLRVDANVTWQDITNQADYNYIDSYNGGGLQTNYEKGFRLPNTPYLFGNASVGYTFHNVFAKNSSLDINYRFNYVHDYFLTWAEYGSKDGKNVIPGQSSHDVEVSYSTSGGRYNISAECRDITDQRLYDKFLLQKPGRSFFVKVRVTL